MPGACDGCYTLRYSVKTRPSGAWLCDECAEKENQPVPRPNSVEDIVQAIESMSWNTSCDAWFTGFEKTKKVALEILAEAQEGKLERVNDGYRNADN